MNDLRYFGTYARLNTISKKDAGQLLGADSIVGDFFNIIFEQSDAGIVAWVVNKFDVRIGYLDSDVSRQLSLCNARSWTIRAILSFVAFTDNPDPGYYWGEVAIICNDTHYDKAVDAFANRVRNLIGEGVRPDINLSTQGIESVLADDGTWMTEARAPFPEKKHGTVILKSRQKLSEKMIEQGRRGNIGCYIVSWVIILAFIAAVAFGLHSLGLF